MRGGRGGGGTGDRRWGRRLREAGGPGSSRARGLSLGENRVYFGLWAIMKSPLLLSADLPRLAPEVLAIVNNSALIAVNQDALGVQARKLSLDGVPLPWLVGLDDCAGVRGFYTRSLGRASDTRAWAVTSREQRPGPGPGNATAARLFEIRNVATQRCLTAGHGTAPSSASAPAEAVVLLPCDASLAEQAWRFDKGAATVTSITNAKTGAALAIGNGTLRGRPHAPDAWATQVRRALCADRAAPMLRVEE